MLVIDWKDLPVLDKHVFLEGVAISIGVFDGIHVGHKVLLNMLKNRAIDMGLLKGVVTFYSPPRSVLDPAMCGCIFSIRWKIAELERMGFDFVVLIDFSVNFARMSGCEFVRFLKEYVNIEYVLVGEDFRFGCDRRFSIKDMKCFSSKFSFCFEVCNNVSFFDSEEKVSSSIIRLAIYDGKIEYASRLLGREVVVDLMEILPCRRSLDGVVFCKKKVLQVLPKAGEFTGSLFFLNVKKSKTVRVIFDKDFFKIKCDGFEVCDETLHFDILKLQAI